MRSLAIMLAVLLMSVPAWSKPKHHKPIPAIIIRPRKPSTWPEVLAIIAREAGQDLEDRQRRDAELQEQALCGPTPLLAPYGGWP